jgi:hypothetical protein
MREFFVPLSKDDEDVEKGIDVIVYNIQGKMFNMKFTLWCQKYYVLSEGWKTFFDLEMISYVFAFRVRRHQT